MKALHNTSPASNGSLLLLLVLWGVLFPMFSSGQINETDTSRFQLQLGVSGLHQSGNVNFTSLRSSLDMGFSMGSHLYLKTQNNYLYQSFSGIRADEDIYSQNFVYFQPQKKWYPYLLGLVATNYRRQLKSRLLGGAGVSYSAWRSEVLRIKLSANVLYEANSFSSNQFNLDNISGNTSPSTWRVTAYADVQVALKGLSLHLNAWYMPSLTWSEWNRFQIDTKLTYALKPWLRVLATNRYTSEDLVPLGVNTEDFILTYGLQINW